MIQPAMTLMTVPRLHNHTTGGDAIEESTEFGDAIANVLFHADRRLHAAEGDR
jgi:hypothetical protein